VIIITPKVIKDPRAISDFTTERNEQVEQASALIMDHQLKLESSDFKDKVDTSAPL
jgi:hypothetical protein